MDTENTTQTLTMVIIWKKMNKWNVVIRVSVSISDTDTYFSRGIGATEHVNNDNWLADRAWQNNNVAKQHITKKWKLQGFELIAWRTQQCKSQVTWTKWTSIEGLLAGSCAKWSNLLCIRTSSALSTFTSNAYLHYRIPSNLSPKPKIF